MKNQLLFFLVFFMLLVSCEGEQVIELQERTTENLPYEMYRGFLEMRADDSFKLGGSNSVEFTADIDIFFEENIFTFISGEYSFDLDESNIHGLHDCSIYRHHSVFGSSEKELRFEVESDFVDCMEGNENEEVLVFEVFVRKD